MKSKFFDLCGFAAAVLFGASFVCPGVAVGLAFLAVIPGALWVLSQCDEPTK